MELCMLVEVGAVPGRGRLHDLLDAVYAAALHQPAGLAFSRRLVPRINRVLDRSVARHGIRRPGVLFLEPDAEETVRLASRCPLVLVSSDRFRSRLEKAGVQVMEMRNWQTAMRGQRASTGRVPATVPTPPPFPSVTFKHTPQR